MAKAKRYGTRPGKPICRPPREIPASFKKYYPMWKVGDITTTDFARLIEVSRPTLYQYIREYEPGKIIPFNLQTSIRVRYTQMGDL